MIRLRTHSIRYETGLIEARKRNQSTAIRLRGVFIDEMKRKTKSSGKSALDRLARAGPQREERAERAEADRDERSVDEQQRDPRRPRREADAEQQAGGDVEDRLQHAEHDDPGELARRGAPRRAPGSATSREKNPVWMSRARSVPAFIVEKSAPWMNGTASAKARNESVGKPGSSRRRLEAARVEEQQRDGEDERRDRARRLARGAHDRALREGADLRRQGAHRRRPPRPRRVGCALERAPGLREEDVVEGRRAQLDVVDDDALGVHRADHVRQPEAVAEAHGEVALVAERLTEAAEQLRDLRPCRSSWHGITWMLGRPISAFSAAGVPSATILPWSMIPTRSASTSASSRYCVVRNTVTLSSRASRATSSQRAVRLCGSRPVVGSSRKRMLGRWTSASARSRRRFMPPE